MKYLVEILDKLEFENKEYEYKFKLETEIDKIEKWAKSIVAFSNCMGGIIFVGVNDDGVAVGLNKKEIDNTKILVLRTINRYIFPHVEVEFEVFKTDELLYVLGIKVDYVNEIVIFKTGDYNEKVYVRENGSSVPASVSKILKMGKRKLGIDNQILKVQYQKNKFKMYNNLAKRYRLDKKEPTIEILMSNEVVNKDGRITQGLNMFSDDYSNDDTLLVCRLWNGYDKGVNESLDIKEFKGSLSYVFDETIKFISRNSRSGFIKMKNGSRLDTLSYPEIAIREAVVNAIAHRDYSIEGTQIDVDIYKDRLEITSPGCWLLDKKTSEYDLKHIPSIRRNKIICNCFQSIGLMEKSGSGIKKIVESYENFKEPKIEANDDFFVITLYDILADKIELDKSGSKYDNLILEYCTDIARSREEIQQYIGYSSRGHFMTEIMKPLLEKGLIVQTAPSKSRNQKYLTKK